MMLVAAVFLVERAVERLLPKGGQRHMVLGRLTMIIFVVVLFTTTLIYFSLYVLYPPRLT